LGKSGFEVSEIGFGLHGDELRLRTGLERFN